MTAPTETLLNRSGVLRYDRKGDGEDGGARAPSLEQTNPHAGYGDMDVNGPGSVPGSFPIKPTRGTPKVPPASETKPIETGDQVEISSAGKMLDKAHQSPEVRAERLVQIKAAIEAGQYETPEMLEAALSKMFSQLGIDDEN